ncbi:rhodanese-like domain-containing protein [Thiotrichales bacterium 19S11-10]|nr:rhodanese-like domain-containing protein [Thiotrichales bacterium 19S11-10]
MSNIITFITENLAITSLFSALVIAYAIFEYIQFKSKSGSVSVSEAVRLLNKEKAIFLDVRGDKLYQNGHIVDAISTSIENLKSSTKFLQKYKSRPVIVYCERGISAKAALNILKESGFNAYNLQGGIKAWREEKLPLHSAVKR